MYQKNVVVWKVLGLRLFVLLVRATWRWVWSSVGLIPTGGKPKYWKRNLSHCHFVSHMCWRRGTVVGFWRFQFVSCSNKLWVLNTTHLVMQWEIIAIRRTPPPPWRCGPTRSVASLLRFLDHTQRRITVGRSPLDAWSVVAETSAWQHITLTTDRHPCPRWDSKPRSQQTSGHWDRHSENHTKHKFAVWTERIIF